MSNIYLVRHGETYWNKLGIMHGQIDVPLNDTGKKQATNVAVQLMNTDFDVCFCSPLQRAVFTAKEILKYHKNIQLIYDDRLMELYKGKLEGTHKNSEQMLKNETLELLITYDIESKAHFFKRVKSFYDEILPTYSNKNILIVAHSGTIKMSMFYFNPPDKNIVEAWYDYHINNCEPYIFKNEMPTTSPTLKEYDIDEKEFSLI